MYIPCYQGPATKCAQLREREHCWSKVLRTKHEMSCFNAVLIAIVVLLGIVLVQHPPQLSKRLLAWKDRGKFFTYKEMDIFYMDEVGEGTSGTVVGLHGFPTFSYDWVKMLPDLKKQFSRVILLDFIGYGFSDKPESHEYSIFEQADIVESLVRKLQVKKVHLLSHDYGDTVALELVARFHQHQATSDHLGLESLCMLNGGLFPGKYYPRLLQKALLVPVLGSVLSRLFLFQIFSRGFGEVFGVYKPTQDEMEDFFAALRHKDGNVVTPGILHYIHERAENEDRWVGTLKNSPIPVLMVYGPADPVNPPPFQDHFREIVPQHKIVVLDKRIGHYPQWEAPDKVMESYKEFLKSLPQQKKT